MYRFYDGDRLRYFTTGNGKMIDSVHVHTQKNGKSSVRRVICDDTVIQ